MNDSLSDIEALFLRCRADRAREYIGEAIQCYRAGAYRSAIVNTWIAVVFDLVDKIRELSLAGDATAQAINAQYEAYIAQINSGNEQGVKNALEFERTILTTCRERLQFFDHQQLSDLNRLREDRHQCAHPSFQRSGEPYRPTAEHARLHLRIAVDHVMSQPPIQGRSAIAELASIVASEYFPKNRGQAVTALRNTPLVAATEALTRGFVDALVFGFADAVSPLYGKMQVGFALAAVLDLQRPIAEPRIARQLSKLVRDIDDVILSSVAVLVASTPEALGLIDQPAVIRLTEFVRSAPPGEAIKAMGPLSAHPDVLPIARARVLTFDFEQLADGVALYGLRDLAKEPALVLLSQAGNWNRVNDIFSRLIMPLFELLQRADIERIVRMPRETRADLPGATGYGNFIAQVQLRPEVIPGEDLDVLLRANQAGYLVAES
ncbi:hypothetical protein [Burkholderia gladioli]|uniref:hypothetical protein n=1 Tax=Burkholderia gladioli TaxID=28095 RepID=UPI00163F856A|nr:hypothetical protein [Burkholderia gladioli]